MKTRSAPLDDVWNELQFALDDDGRSHARLLRVMFAWAYRILKGAMLAALRIRWQCQHVAHFPELGFEPFNLTETELDLEWTKR